MWTVYILECEDKSLYTGVTNNLEKRFSDHVSGRGASYTRSHKPVKVVYKERKRQKGRALSREAEIKRMTRSKKLLLIESREK